MDFLLSTLSISVLDTYFFVAKKLGVHSFFYFSFQVMMKIEVKVGENKDENEEVEKK